jgi:PKHD-type hydroxylase
MMLRVPEVLSAQAIARVRSIIDTADWSAGVNTLTPGRNNRQLPEDGKAARAARALVLDGLSQSAMFVTGTLPRNIFPPLFNRYDGAANDYGKHVDSAVRTWAPAGTHLRSDIAATLFLSDPREYEGGELVIEEAYGAQTIKLRAGELILYPASKVHAILPVTRGSRLAAVFWVESMVRDDEQRRLLYELDMSILALRGRHGDNAELQRLTGCYNNLLRMWATP